jgi:acetyl esterase/lipase
MAALSVEYRLAPDTPYPGPLDDCHAGLVGAAAHVADLGVDPDRIVNAGMRADGGLAAALALLNRARESPALRGQMGLCPMLDDRDRTYSSHQMSGRGLRDRTSNATAWQAYLGDRYGTDDVP